VDAPPVIVDHAPPGPAVSRARTIGMLILLLMVPPVLGIIGDRNAGGTPDAVALPGSLLGLIQVSVINLGLMVLIGAVVAWLGRPRWAELMADACLGWKAWVLGLGYSVLFRFALGFVMMAALLLKVVVWGLQGRAVETLDGLRPQIENMLDPTSLRDPVYFVFVTTVVSFIVAGLREELWRAAVFAGLARLSPRGLNPWSSRVGASALAAVVFGLGHLTQGWSGVFLTGGLGFGLGLILLAHRSLWVAVLAHGFFNAASFVLLRLIDQTGQLDVLLGRPDGH
jgi:membrane protease YdiL (CAAX protease family)